MFKTTDFQSNLDKLTRFTSKQERDALLVGDNDTFEILEILSGGKVKAITELEAMVYIFKLREISVGEDFLLTVRCEHCENVNEVNINRMEFGSGDLTTF